MVTWRSDQPPSGCAINTAVEVIGGRLARKIVTVGRVLCLLVALQLAAACGSSHHQAYTQSGDFDSGLVARAAEFVSALNAKDTHQLQALVFPNQKNEVPAFLAAYGGQKAGVTDQQCA
jgi:hypothetical protein